MRLTIKAYNVFVDECKLDGSIKLNPDKNCYYFFHDEPISKCILSSLNSFNFKIKRKAATILGTPIGIDKSAVETLACDKVTDYLTLFDRLQHEAMPDVSADQILRRCGVPSMTYLTRTVAPSLIRKAARNFDSWVTDAYITKHKFSKSSFTPSMHDQLTLPLRLCVMGLRNHEQTCVFAYIGAAACVAQRLSHIILSPSSPYALNIQAAVTEISTILPSTIIQNSSKIFKRN